MSEDAPVMPGEYAPLGLVSNPFRPHDPDTVASIGTALTSHAWANRLIGALVLASAEAQSPVIWVDKSPGMGFSEIAATAEVLGRLSSDDSLGVMPVYIQLQAMKSGRIRGALSMTAEKITGSRCDKTIAAWTLRVLQEPDTQLPEWGALAGCDLSAIMSGLAEQPIETAEMLYGPLVPEREGVRRDMELLMRISAARQERLETEPTESETSDEEDLDDPGRDAFVQPLIDEESAPALTAEEVSAAADAGIPVAEAVVGYVLAHTAKHLSPVVARGIQAYVAQGTSSMAQELKVTKAPRKTLRALTSFASARYKKTALLWDRLDPWILMEPDMKIKVATSMTEVRWAIADSGVMVVLASRGQAPELEEQFAAARRIEWDSSLLVGLDDDDARYDADLVDTWLASAASPGATPMSAKTGPLADLAERCAGRLDPFVRAAAIAVDSAALRGAATVEDEDLQRALGEL